MRNKGKRDSKKLVLCSILVGLLMLTACSKNAPEKLKVEIYPQADYWAVMDLSNTCFPTEEACEELANQYVKEIETLLHMEGWWQEVNPDATVLELSIQIGATPQSVTFSTAQKTSENSVSGGILLSSSIAKKASKDAAFAHELTHLMGFMNENSFSLSMTEGLCDYVQAEVGDYPYGELDIQEFIAYMLRADFENAEVRALEEAVIEKVGAPDSGYPYGQGGELSFWYTMSQSFVRYLIEEYGIDAVKKLVLEGEDEGSYEEMLGKPLSQLKKEWMEQLFTMEISITEEDILRNTSG